MAEAGKANWAVGTRSIGVTGGLRAAVQQSGIATRRLGELMEAQLSTPEEKCIGFPEQKYISEAGKKGR